MNIPRAYCQKGVALLAVVMSMSAVAQVDRPDVGHWSGTAYRDGGWFTYQMKEAYSDGALRFESSDAFVLSPRYSAPIRKVAIKAVCKSDSPLRFLQLAPFANGVQDDSLHVGDERATNGVAVVKDIASSLVFDFPASSGVDAVRLFLGSGSKGTWAVSDICVFYGEKTADEDAVLLAFASQLSAPEDLHVSDFTTTSLSLSASEVSGAAGYAFEVVRLEGAPETELRENFASAPALSASGWTISSVNANLDAYSSSGYYDTATGDKSALKIERQSSSGDVTVEVETPVCEAAIRSCSFVCKVGATGKSDVFRVMGRANASSEWAVLHEFVPVGTGRTNVMVDVDVAADVRQAKFVFSAAAANFTVASLDSLSIVYGGDESRTAVESGATVFDVPQFAADALPTARYAFRIRALGGEGRKDSSWSDEQVVDLAWADISVSPPAGVAVVSSGSSLRVSWEAVENAAWYLVTVAPADDPGSPVVADLRTTATSCAVAVPALGEYSATVTAVSPGGKSSAAASVAAQATLGAVGAVSAEAVDRTSIEATWKAVPLSEGYRVRLLRLSGDVETDSPAYPDKFADDVEWGGGWTSYGIYDTYAGPLPKINHSGSWITTRAYDQPVTAVSFRMTNRASSDEIADATRLTVSTSPSVYGDDWTVRFVTNNTASARLAFAASDGVRRIRFAFSLELQGLDKSPLAEFGRVAVTSGDETRTVEAVLHATDCAATFSGLDPASRYAVEVTPQPSDGEDLASVSDPVDLATERFRLTGAAPLRGTIFEEGFAVLTNMTGDTVVRNVGLDYWQFMKGSAEPEKLLLTTGATRSTGGVYAFCDADRSDDSFALGSLATSSYGCAIGIALVNDGATAVDGDMTLSFTSIQRNFRANTATYILEWKVTDGETGIDSDGGWTAMELPPTAPYVAEDPNRPSAGYAQTVSVKLELGKHLEHGNVLILRWRHPKVASGPMMAIDNVRLDFTRQQQALRMILR